MPRDIAVCWPSMSGAVAGLVVQLASGYREVATVLGLASIPLVRAAR